ncbi:hypothetical protein BB934_44235 (plasmid) [Microvirga ossetica]|uniref:Uncharacterized protein n=1 Tax=Microvirga ossetica TaxID=1882682 RepID=A0A1B2EZK8_9HYPH|nr:hypothetical protein BB934_44235 [Microvirga ossetica]
MNLIPLRARARPEPASADDRSIMLMVVLLLGLVFVPIIGLHVAAVAFDLEAAASPPDNLAHHVIPPAKPTRG